MRRGVMHNSMFLGVSNADCLEPNAASRLKDMVLSTNQLQRLHQDCIGEIDGALTGLIFAARNGNATTQYHACLTLAQLAWSHDQNSFRIPEVSFSSPSDTCPRVPVSDSRPQQVPGAPDVLAAVLLTATNDRAKEYAAVTVGKLSSTHA